MRALRNLLYGIPGNTSDHFLHDYRNLRIGATLARRDGRQLEIVRRKGNKGTLLPPDEKEPLEESILHGFLGGCDQAQFETMFGIDHPGLIAGGQDIIRGQGDIGHVLFAAGAGISDLRTIRNNLDKQAEELFSPRGFKPAVNQAITELNKAKKLIRDSQLPSSEWQKHKAALEDATGQLTVTEEKLGELSRQKTRLQRLAGALPAIGRFRTCEEKLNGMGEVPILPADFAENRRDTISHLETARHAEQEAAAEIARLDGQIEALAVPEGLVSRAAEIEAVYKELSVYRKAQSDLPGLIAKREHLEKEAAALLRELRPELVLADADQLSSRGDSRSRSRIWATARKPSKSNCPSAERNRRQSATAGRRFGSTGATSAAVRSGPAGRGHPRGPQPGQPFATGGRPAGRDCRTRQAGGDRFAQAGALERIAGRLGKAGLARDGNDHSFRPQPLRCRRGDRSPAGAVGKSPC